MKQKALVFLYWIFFSDMVFDLANGLRWNIAYIKRPNCEIGMAFSWFLISTCHIFKLGLLRRWLWWRFPFLFLDWTIVQCCACEWKSVFSVVPKGSKIGQCCASCLKSVMLRRKSVAGRPNVDSSQPYSSAIGGQRVLKFWARIIWNPQLGLITIFELKSLARITQSFSLFHQPKRFLLWNFLEAERWSK